MKITDLKVNGIREPLGFSCGQLSFSWKVRDTRAKRQRNARVEIAAAPDFAELIAVRESADLSCRGTSVSLEVKPRTVYYWRVTVTADSGEEAVSETARFETGKIAEPWRAQWIASGQGEAFHPLFRKNFTARRGVVSARLYICGLGLYEASLNGEKVGEEYLTPYINDYMESFQYQTFDVTGQIGRENQMEILLGKGWYMGVFGLQMKSCLFGDRMQVIAELHLRYADGSEEVVATDESWQYQGSDIEESGIYFGETVNRLLWKGKNNAWRPAAAVPAPGKLCERFSLPVRAAETLHPTEIITTPAGETVIDFGQNHAGFMEFTADFAAGTKVIFECGEILQEGNFYRGNYREAESAFTYISDGRRERVRPHFTYFGYRYLRVTGWPGEPGTEDICSRVLSSDLERIGYLETGNEKINRLYENSLWGLRSNFIDMPTDCPQRNERLGWTGDAQIFAPTASWHMDTRAFYRKFLRDLRSEQVRADGGVPNYIPSLGDFAGACSVWGDSATLIPETLYQFYGDLSDMEQYYPLVRDWVEYMRRVDAQTGDARLFRPGFQFGDWLALDGVTEESFKGSTDDDYIGSVYYYRSAQIAADMAKRLGKAEDAAKYRTLTGEIRKAILDEYFTPSGRISVDTQAAYLVAMRFGIYRDPEKLKEQFAERMKKDCYQIRCGFVGAPLLCVTLADNGMSDLAYDFLFYEGYPGWLYAVNLGATTIWERWNSVLPDGSMSPTGMNSLNHYAYGSVVEFFYEYMAGIRPLEPGFRKVRIAPKPDIRLGRVQCSYDSVSGRYVSGWEIREDGTLRMNVEIPFDCEAEVMLPDCDGSDLKVREVLTDSRVAPGSKDTKEGRGDALWVLHAGIYEFSYTPTRDYRYPYGPATRLAQLAGDERAMRILREELPVAAKIIETGDRENMTCTLAELQFMRYLGFEPGQVKAAAEKIFSLRL